MLDAVGTALFDDPLVRGIVVNARDVTDRVALENELRHAQKLEAVGRLAGGVAHDFNNLLTVIVGYCTLLRQSLDPEHGGVTYADEIESAARSGAKLVQQMLAFSRRQILRPQVLNLNSLLTEIEPMLRGLLGDGIELVLVLSSRLRKVRADPSQVTQVILNLSANARDAMPTGGVLRIETANHDVPGTIPIESSLPPGSYVRMRIVDEGIGMDEVTSAQAIEPFFTTKEIGESSGLGLSTAYGIVKQSGGTIEIESAPGSGTAVSIYLPPVAAATVQPHEPAAGPVRGTVLLVDDSDSVRAVARLVLSQGGFRVLEAASPGHALDIAKQYKESLDLLLTDMVMPGMSGRQLADRLRQEHPDLPVLYTTGYALDAFVDQFGGSTEEILRKPFDPDVLVGRVERAIGR
jgi:nitrogen-specific signal transduction histidine kinase/CheY-like chemotaxis protein